MQNHQPGIPRGQLFVGAHPHPRVLRPVGWRGGWIRLEILFLVPFGVDLSGVRVTVIMLCGDREGEGEDQEEAFRKSHGALHPWEGRESEEEGEVGEQ